jgi:hypothetical protein
VFPKRDVLSPDYHEDYERDSEPFWDRDPDFGDYLATGVPPRLRTMVSAKRVRARPLDDWEFQPGRLQARRVYEQTQDARWKYNQWFERFRKKRGIDRAVDRITGKRLPNELVGIIGQYIYDPANAGPMEPRPK